MTKRHLSQQQLRRIHAQQRQTEGVWGLIVTHQGKLVQVEDQQGQRHLCHFRQNLGEIVVGDHVRWEKTAHSEGVIVSIEPRETLLARTTRRGAYKPMAANIQQMLIVIAPIPAPTRLLIDSYTVIAEILHIQPMLICNKYDLFSEELELNQMLTEYRQLGFPIVLTSCVENSGIATLLGHLSHHTSILVGQSGVGKSSLLKQLLPALDIAIGELGTGTAHGRHTTTQTVLYHLPNEGILIDSPGIREFGLWAMSAAELARGFKEFQLYLGQCQFRNCQHGNEKGCAIHAAVTRGDITAPRWESYQALLAKYKSS